MLYMMLYSVFRKIRRSFSFSDNLVIKDSIFVQFSDAGLVACRTRNEADRYGAVRHSALRELRGNAPRGNELRGNGTQPKKRDDMVLLARYTVLRNF